ILDDRIKNNEKLDDKIISCLQTSEIFLNGNDPFIPEYWVAGKTLVFGAQEDIGTGFHKVYNDFENNGHCVQQRSLCS
ncbi:17333_t:CDS:1, partial [Gigaspora rosea]